MLSQTLKLLRPHQYIKNFFVLVGTLFSHQWDNKTITEAAILFLAFCSVSSAVYVLNDLIDAKADRQHPIKCLRPIASGTISRTYATFLFIALLMSAIFLAATINHSVLLFILGYFTMNIFYSLHLKHIVILDVFIIACGFMLRLLAGTVGLEIEPSQWLLLCGLMITLFLGFAKRRSELLIAEQAGNLNSRQVLSDYSPVLLEMLLAITAACTILSYGLYTVSPQTEALHGNHQLIISLPLVMYGIFRYLHLLFRQNAGGDTAKDIFSDSHLLVIGLLWVITIIWSLN